MAGRVVIVPGNGGGDVRSCNFYGWAEQEFKVRGYDVRLSDMPDPLYAREKNWIPFILDKLNCDSSSVLIGHSSGAAAALRLAEKNRLRGMVLVAAYDSDLGDELERGSGYFSRPFDWATIMSNCGWIVQYAGDADDLVPIGVQRGVAENLKGVGGSFEYCEIEGGDHFFSAPWPDLIAKVEEKMGN